MAIQNAILGGGCFWCIESSFNRVNGVIKAISGYCGGNAEDADYRSVCSGLTNHAEVVWLEFDDDKVSYEQILDIFFYLHDPTQLNRQGNDIGRQYRSSIFYLNENQQTVALAKVAQLNASGLYQEPLVTEVVEVMPFYPAEDYHQGYYDANPEQAYCQFIISPKMAKFSEKFHHLLRQSG